MKMIDAGLVSAAIAAILMFPTTPVLAMESDSSGPNITVETEESSVMYGDDGEIKNTILGGGEITPQPDKTQIPENGLGTIRISLTDSVDGLPKDGVKFAVLQVADIIDGNYELRDEFEKADIDLNNLENAESLEMAAEALEETAMEVGLISKDQPQAITDSNGIVELTGLSVGVYLITAVDIAGYDLISPTLVAIPTWDANDQIFVYDLDIEPKHSNLPSVEVNKIDSETGKNITNKDFEFTAYDDESLKDAVMVEKGDTEQGTAMFTVTYGTYYIKETGAPEGYLLSDEVVKVEFKTDDTLWINDKEVKLPEDKVYSIVYKNTLKSSGFFSSANTAANSGLILWASLAAGTGVLTLVIMKKRKKG